MSEPRSDLREALSWARGNAAITAAVHRLARADDAYEALCDAHGVRLARAIAEIGYARDDLARALDAVLLDMRACRMGVEKQ